eukprot:TRINITY_DN20714_c0_g1_i1.p1 TRINITY_DN20714_c0_g1~~TRINITY_DN20714_c0_g1_i1.p1  ORF type:complete len:516 (+),score=106.45 TRINITY_DN20714_c0_g1_i1:119-1666(+)
MARSKSESPYFVAGPSEPRDASVASLANRRKVQLVTLSLASPRSPHVGASRNNGGYSPRGGGSPQKSPTLSKSLGKHRRFSMPAKQQQVETPTTAAESSADGSWDTLPGTSRVSDGSRTNKISTSSFHASLKLATGVASQEFVDRAEQLLGGDSDVFAETVCTPGFSDAMSSQGIDASDLQSDSGLSKERRVSLLAAVLQEHDTQQRECVSPKCVSILPARRLQHQLMCRRAESLDRVKSKNERRRLSLSRAADSASTRLAELQAHLEEQEKISRGWADEQAKASEEKKRERGRLWDLWRGSVEHGAELREIRRIGHKAALESQEERFSCWLEAHEEAAAERQRIRLQKSEQWSATLERAADVKAEQLAERVAALDAKDERSRRCLDEQQEAQVAMVHRLAHRFQLVASAGQEAQHEAQVRALQKGEELSRKLERHREHTEEHRAKLEAEQQRRREMAQEREHQVQRISRIKVYQRFKRIDNMDEDMAIFNECSGLRTVTNIGLSQAAKGALEVL